MSDKTIPEDGSVRGAVTLAAAANPLADAFVRGKVNTPEFWLLARRYATAPAGAARHAAEEAMLNHLAAAISPPASSAADIENLAASTSMLASWLDENGLHSNASDVRALINLIPLRMTVREQDLRRALERLCTHETRTSAQIDADWDFARSVLVRAARVQVGRETSMPAQAVAVREPFDFEEWFNEHSEGAQLRIGKDLRDFERAITEWAEKQIGVAIAATSDVSSAAQADAKDAALWRYTQQEGYFSVGQASGGPLDVAVGVKTHHQSVNSGIQGRGATLKEAIEDALRRATPASESRPVTHRGP